MYSGISDTIRRIRSLGLRFGPCYRDQLWRVVGSREGRVAVRLSRPATEPAAVRPSGRPGEVWTWAVISNSRLEAKEDIFSS